MTAILRFNPNHHHRTPSQNRVGIKEMIKLPPTILLWYEALEALAPFFVSIVLNDFFYFSGGRW